MSKVTIFFSFFFEKWKTNGKQIRRIKKRRVDISIHISSTCWVGRGGGQNTLLDNMLLNMSDYLRTSSALLTNHHIVKNEVKQV